MQTYLMDYEIEIIENAAEELLTSYIDSEPLLANKGFRKLTDFVNLLLDDRYKVGVDVGKNRVRNKMLEGIAQMISEI